MANPDRRPFLVFQTGTENSSNVKPPEVPFRTHFSNFFLKIWRSGCFSTGISSVALFIPEIGGRGGSLTVIEKEDLAWSILVAGRHSNLMNLNREQLCHGPCKESQQWTFLRWENPFNSYQPEIQSSLMVRKFWASSYSMMVFAFFLQYEIFGLLGGHQSYMYATQHMTSHYWGGVLIWDISENNIFYQLGQKHNIPFLLKTITSTFKNVLIYVRTGEMAFYMSQIHLWLQKKKGRYLQAGNKSKKTCIFRLVTQRSLVTSE